MHLERERSLLAVVEEEEGKENIRRGLGPLLFGLVFLQKKEDFLVMVISRELVLQEPLDSNMEEEERDRDNNMDRGNREVGALRCCSR